MRGRDSRRRIGLARSSRAPTHSPPDPAIAFTTNHQGETFMKLVRFGAPGREKPGIIDDKGRIRDLSKVVPDIAGETLSPQGPRQDQARPTSPSCRP